MGGSLFYNLFLKEKSDHLTPVQLVLVQPVSLCQKKIQILNIAGNLIQTLHTVKKRLVLNFSTMDSSLLTVCMKAAVSPVSCQRGLLCETAPKYNKQTCLRVVLLMALHRPLSVFVEDLKKKEKEKKLSGKIKTAFRGQSVT